MASADSPPLLLLHELLDYDAASGALTWRPRLADMFRDGSQSAEHNCAIWNGKFAGKPALSALDKRGYRHGHLLRSKVKAHRVIWAMAYGAWPDGEIDHVDGDPANNRLSNLRLVSHAINGKNLRLKKNNTTGACGIRQRPSGRWAAHMQVDGRHITIGTFDSKEEAILARSKAEVLHGFHRNHGRRV